MHFRLLVLLRLVLLSSGDSSADMPLVKQDVLRRHGAVIFSDPDVDSYTSYFLDLGYHSSRPPSILVSAKNRLIRFDPLLTKYEVIDLSPTEDEIEQCKDKGHTDDDCQNYIKFLFITNLSNKPVAFACGTFTYYPKCSARDAGNLKTELPQYSLARMVASSPRRGIAAYGYNSTLIYGSNFEEIRTVLLRRGFQKDSSIVQTKSGPEWFNNAEIVHTFSKSTDDKFVYFIFREVALEPPDEGKVVSRIARLCKYDEGGVGELQGIFSSFTKARLVCEAYDEVQGVTYIENGNFFWATFKRTGRSGSAICRYRFSMVDTVFQGPFKCNSTNPAWGTCTIPPLHPLDERVVTTCFGNRPLKAIPEYILMDQPVTPYCQHPIFKSSSNLFNKVAISSPKEDAYTAFIGDDLGRIWKMEFLYCKPAKGSEIWEVVPADETTKTINLLTFSNSSVFVFTESFIMKIPVIDYHRFSEGSDRDAVPLRPTRSRPSQTAGKSIAGRATEYRRNRPANRVTDIAKPIRKTKLPDGNQGCQIQTSLATLSLCFTLSGWTHGLE